MQAVNSESSRPVSDSKSRDPPKAMTAWCSRVGWETRLGTSLEAARQTRTSAVMSSIGKERHALQPGKFEAALHRRAFESATHVRQAMLNCFITPSAGNMSQQGSPYRKLIRNLSYCLGSMSIRSSHGLEPSPRLDTHRHKNNVCR